VDRCAGRPLPTTWNRYEGIIARHIRPRWGNVGYRQCCSRGEPAARPPAGEEVLSHQQVQELADGCGPEYRLMVLFLAYTGLRWGEMAALRVHRIDFLRRRVLVAESVTPVAGRMTFGPQRATSGVRCRFHGS
jgi:integrase